MRKRMTVLLCALLVACSALAEDGEKEKKKDDRWKITIGGVPVGIGAVSDTENLGWGENFRADDGIRSWSRNYYYEYIDFYSDGGIDQGRRLDFYLQSNVLCCAAVPVLIHAENFRGQVGDEYFLWTRTQGGRVTKNGVGFSTSLEYRAWAGLWAALSFQMSAENELQRTESGEYVRVTEIERFPADRYFNFSHPVPYWYIHATRHRIVRQSEDKHRFFTFTPSVKYDLTRGSKHWSIMPQAGAEIMLSRENSRVTERFYDWRIFSGEYHPSSWAHQPREVDTKEYTTVRWNDWVRPVAGLTIELYPGGKESHVGLVVDGRYRFLGEQPWTSVTEGNVNWHGNKYWGPRFIESADEFMVPYWYNADAREWTISFGGVIRF